MSCSNKIPCDMNKNPIPEILAPVGSKEAFYSAIAAGCDALYLGGKDFGARSYANNFSFEELGDMVDYAHLFDVKIYYTLNTLVKDIEIRDLLQVLQSLVDIKVDAVIIQDMGVYQLILDHQPDLVVHGSTQMNLHSVEDVSLAKNLGFDRVVLSRECSLMDIRKIKDQVEIEIEAFVHGALCYCYSGGCLMSSLYGGRSGNRGKCAQPCRMAYTIDDEKAYFLSPKDQMTLGILPDLIEAGIDSFKIEGRMKSPEYVYAAVSIYKKYRDLALNLLEDNRVKDYKVSSQDIEILNQLFNRGHFTEGYYKQHNSDKMISYDHGKNLGLEVGSISYKKGLTIDLDQPVSKEDLLEIHVPGQLMTYAFQLDHDADEIYMTKQLFTNKGDLINTDFIKGHPGLKVYRIRDHKLLEKFRDYHSPLLSIDYTVMAFIDEPLQVIGSYMDRYTVVLQGSTVQVAANRPTDHKSIRKQLAKLGDTAFVIGDLTLLGDESIFIPLSELNQLRRQICDELKRQILESYQRPGKSLTEYSLHKTLPGPRESDQGMETGSAKREGQDNCHQFSYLIKSVEQWETLFEWCKNHGETLGSQIGFLYLDVNDIQAKALIHILHESQKLKQSLPEFSVYLALPHVLFHQYNEILMKKLQDIDTILYDGFLIRTLGQIKIARDFNKVFCTDYNLHVFNEPAVEAYKGLGALRVTGSLELNRQAIRQIGSKSTEVEVLIYGRSPLMNAANCLYRTRYKKCQKSSDGHRLVLEDRKGEKQEVFCHCDFCYNTIYNSKALYLLDQKVNAGVLRLEFTSESGDEMKKVLDEHGGVVLKDFDQDLYTRGHYKRGVL